MSLYDQIIAAYPELADNTDEFAKGSIMLQNDSDGTGDYIAKWEYIKPLTKELSKFIR